jgi:N-acetylmuramic acid 6-phosphate (MurNAc-6-P) etherase
LGEDDLKALNLTAQDLVVGLASGRTPYVTGAGIRQTDRLHHGGYLL